MKTIEANGRTLEEAVQIAAQELGVGTDAVEYETVEEGTKGFLGLGQTPTRIKAWVREGYVPVPAPVKAPVVEESEVEEIEVEQAEPGQAVPAYEPPPGGDAYVDALMKMLTDVLNEMRLDAKPMLKSVQEDEVEIDIVGKDLAILIGKHGQTLDALQYLVGIAAAKHEISRRRVVLDAEGYRAHRRDMLERKAREYARAVKEQGREAVLEPQSARERRIVHMVLADDPYVYTYSEGEGDDRHVVISPKK